MKKLLLFSLICISSFAIQAQEINNIIAYSQLNNTRIVATTNADQLYSYTLKEGWNLLGKGEFPPGKVTFMGSYQQPTGTRLMIAMQDQSIWRLKEDKWLKMSQEGLPESFSIKSFRPFTYQKSAGFSGAAFVLLYDGTLWTFSEDKNWLPLDKMGLPKLEVTLISSFQKAKGLNRQTQYLAVLSNQGLFKRSETDTKWLRIETRQLPKGFKIKTVDSYLKTPLGGAAEGRIILSLQDGSIWWTSEKEVLWKKIKTEELPKGYEILKIKVFQKNNTSRLLVLLADNSLWWYVESEGFQAVSMEGFGS